MAQIPPPGLPPELTGTQGPAPVAPGGPTGPGGPSIRETMTPLVETPADDFLNELLSIADELGMMDTMDPMGTQPSVGEEVDQLDTQANPLELLSREQLDILIQKFFAIPEPTRSEILTRIKAELPPQVGKRLDAIIRMVQGGGEAA